MPHVKNKCEGSGEVAAYGQSTRKNPSSVFYHWDHYDMLPSSLGERAKCLWCGKEVAVSRLGKLITHSDD